MVDEFGAPDRIRTCDLCLRRAALYPAELRVRAAGTGSPHRPGPQDGGTGADYIAEAARRFNRRCREGCVRARAAYDPSLTMASSPTPRGCVRASAACDAGTRARTALRQALGVPHCAEPARSRRRHRRTHRHGRRYPAPPSAAARPAVAARGQAGEAVRAAYPGARPVRAAAGTARRAGRSPKPKARRSGQGRRSAATAIASDTAAVTRTTSPNLVQAPASIGSTW